jgi:mono/diheme cytochrome c family protein
VNVKNYLVTSALLVFALPGAAQQGQPAKASRASIANGENVYLRVGCHACHGTVGHGGAGTRLAPNTLPKEAFELWVRKGTPGWTTMSGMPAFSAAVVTDEELADIRAYLASLPSPPAADDIPLLTP